MTVLSWPLGLPLLQTTGGIVISGMKFNNYIMKITYVSVCLPYNGTFL